jgi:hypothetical protein
MFRKEGGAEQAANTRTRLNVGTFRNKLLTHNDARRIAANNKRGASGGSPLPYLILPLQILTR